ncbi:hypothetical protein D3C78_1360110 [compost metagenome]
MHFGKQFNLTTLDLFRHLRQLTGDAGEHALVFFGTQQVEQRARLAVVIIVFTVIPVVSGTFNAQRRFAEVRLLLEQAETVWLVGGSVAAVTVHAHRTVTMIVVERAFWAVHRDLMVIYAQTITVRIPVGEQTPLQHLVWRETHARYHVGRVHRHLFHF